MPPVSFEPGTVLAGKYRVECVLGKGGMGIVIAAWHEALGRRVAMKFLVTEGFETTEARARFEREARAASALQSEHVVRILDVGVLDGDLPYMVMEHLQGQDLSALSESRTLPVDEVVDYVLQACEAIAEAHRQNIIHRDLKPANLFLTRRPDGSPLVKVLDFGISKIDSPSGQSGDASGASGSLTRTQGLLGSPMYMSPEQLRSSKLVDPRTDIWALGIILHELLTGGSPFPSESLHELLSRIAADPPMPVRAARPEVPDGLEAVILRCLEKVPANRHANVAELAKALRPFASSLGAASVDSISRILGVEAAPGTAHVLAPKSSTPAGAQTGRAWGQTSKDSKAASGSRLPLWIGLASVVAIGSGALFLRSGNSESAVSEPSAPHPRAASAATVTATPATPTETPRAPPAVAPTGSTPAVQSNTTQPAKPVSAAPTGSKRAPRPATTKPVAAVAPTTPTSASSGLSPSTALSKPNPLSGRK